LHFDFSLRLCLCARSVDYIIFRGGDHLGYTKAFFGVMIYLSFCHSKLYHVLNHSFLPFTALTATQPTSHINITQYHTIHHKASIFRALLQTIKCFLFIRNVLSSSCFFYSYSPYIIAPNFPCPPVCLAETLAGVRPCVRPI
jgi:hypothetical protein